MPCKKSNIDSSTTQAQVVSGNIGNHRSSMMAEFDCLVADAILESNGLISASLNFPVVAETPCTPPRDTAVLSSSNDGTNNKDTSVDEEVVVDEVDFLLEQQMLTVTPSPVKITKADNPLVCLLKFFVLGSTPRIALAVSIQNLPSLETQQCMQGNNETFHFN